MSKHWTPKVGDEVLIETQKRSGLANIVSIDLEPLVSDSPDYFVHMRDGSADLWVFREEMEFMHRNEDPTPPPAPVSDIDERRIAARDQEIQYLQRQIAALKAEVERLRAALAVLKLMAAADADPPQNESLTTSE